MNRPYATLAELEAKHASFDEPPRFPVTVEGAARLLCYMEHVRRLFATARMAFIKGENQ